MTVGHLVMLLASVPFAGLLLAGCPDLELGGGATIAGITAGSEAFERSCWDVNSNGVGDQFEDVNEDGNFDELDCLAAAGDTGPTGPEGPAGPQGETGAQGPAGEDGVNCWDLNANGVDDPDEDTNGDRVFNALDCAGVQGATGEPGPEGPAGPQGATGPAGDGLTYGDGSAGPKTLAVSATLTDVNLQYTNFTIEVGVTLTIPSGAVIRCTGTFTNNGAIVVQTSARGGTETATIPSVDTSYTPPHPGVAISSAASGEYGSNAATRVGGLGGVAINAFAARFILQPGPNAGGGGGGAIGGLGGAGGGSLVIIARTAVNNYGTITANGAAGPIRCGGGGGGIVILASPGAVVNTGTINANGGNGGNSDASAGTGGGGGGGIVHLVGPTVVPGTVNVLGGGGGASAGAVTSDPRQGGGGGGACGGNGGTGGSVTAAGTTATGGAGSTGQFLQTPVDPAGLF